LSLQKVLKNFRKEREEYAAKVMQAAKEDDAVLKAKLEARIEKLDAQLQNLEFNIAKDMSHLQNTYESEIKNLGTKIEDLRSELRNQHSQLISLLSDIVKKSK
jgi:CII-binding regulator of phage lambda lysogenization HflD